MRAKFVLPAIAAGLIVLAGCDIEDLGGFERYHEDFHFSYPLKPGGRLNVDRDRKSTRLNSSHLVISYAVFCLKKKENRANGECTSRYAALVVRIYVACVGV